MSRRIFIICFTVFFVFTTALGCRDRGSDVPEKITLKVWGIFDSQSDLQPLFNSYRQLRPNVTIDYRTIGLSEYESILLNALAGGEGPDVFLMHNKWLPKFKNKISPAPEDMLPFDAVEEAFVPTIIEDLTEDETIYALSAYVDSLALLYNFDHYRRTLRGKPHEDWDNFLAEDVAILNDRVGQSIVSSGFALGASNNINQSADIFFNLLLQNDISFYSEDESRTTLSSNEVRDVLTWYTSFANPASDLYTWSPEFNDDIFEFVQGNVSTIVGYSYLVEQIAVQARTRGLNFRTAPLPQFDVRNPVNFSDYWAYTARKNAAEPYKERFSWDFIKHMISQDSVETYFNTLHRPPSRRDVIEKHLDDPLYGPFVDQARFAESIVMYDRERYNEAIEEAIAAVNEGEDVNQAIREADTKIQAIIDLYRE